MSCHRPPKAQMGAGALNSDSSTVGSAQPCMIDRGLRRARLRGQVSRSLSSRISTNMSLSSKEKKIPPACGGGQKAMERHLQTGKKERERLQGGASQTHW